MIIALLILIAFILDVALLNGFITKLAIGLCMIGCVIGVVGFLATLAIGALL